MTEQNSLEILVVEDTQRHQEAAKHLLKDHNLDIVGTFDEVGDLLARGSFGKGKLRKKYDVVITDGFFPQGRGDCMANPEMGLEQNFFGYAVVLMAIKENVPYIALISDANHHSHPLAYTLDFLEATDDNGEAIAIPINNSKVLFLNGLSPNRGYTTPERIYPKREFMYRTKDGVIAPESEILITKPTLDGKRTYQCAPEGAELVKNYRAILEVLLKR